MPWPDCHFNLLIFHMLNLNRSSRGPVLINSSCWTRIYPAFANSLDPDQLASEEANWSGSTLFAIKYVNL